MKTIKRHITLFLILVFYLIMGNITHIYIPCPFHEILHIYCPGCGITRMFINIFKLDFISAFKCNQFVFILLPFGLVLYINYIYSILNNKKSWYERIPAWIFYILIVIALGYGILRNFIPVLAPIE
jgi:hypothetical protein